MIAIWYIVQSRAPATLPFAAVLTCGYSSKECKQRQFTDGPAIRSKAFAIGGACLADSPGREGRIATWRWEERAFTQRPFALWARRSRVRILRQRGIICGQCHWYGTMSLRPTFFSCRVPSSFNFGIETITLACPYGRPAWILRLRSDAYFFGGKTGRRHASHLKNPPAYIRCGVVKGTYYSRL